MRTQDKRLKGKSQYAYVINTNSVYRLNINLKSVDHVMYPKKIQYIE